MTHIESRFGNRNYYLTREQINQLNFKSTENEKPKEKRRDIYAEMPLRALGYSNELGEAIRPLSPMLANLSWLPAIGYISADIADKYRQDEFSVKDPSKSRASKQLVTQLLASVFLPTVAVKAGQGLTNNVSAFGKTKLSLNNREKISDIVINSMKQGEHKDFLDENGKVNKEEYKKSLSQKFNEITKHKNTHKKHNPISAFVGFIKKPFSPNQSNIDKYAGDVVDRLIDTRQQLLDGEKPNNISNKKFQKYLKATENVAQSEKQSVVFDMVRKAEKNKMFKNKIIKSLGGLAALSIMAKPIDKFVETKIMEPIVGPRIDNISAMHKKQQQAKQETQSVNG